MKLRYYMRGLGIGMVVTALVMGIATKEGLPLTDAEIKAKALALGMVEEDSIRLSDIQSSPDPGVHGEETGETGEGLDGTAGEEGLDSMEDESGTASVGTEGAGTDGAGTEDAGTEDMGGSGQAPGQDGTSAGEGAPADGMPSVITIVVEDGAGSYRVCEQLEEAGLVEDAWEYDKYLIDNGCSKKVHAGTHQIPAGAGWEEIMGIITRTGN